MKTTHFIPLAVAAVAALSISSCSTTEVAASAPIAQPPVTVGTSPASVAGKKIIMDFSSAQYRDRNDGMPDGVWNAWTPSGGETITTRAFGRNNKCLNEKSEYGVCYWSYTKTGGSTAELDNGISGESDMGFPTTYILTFDSDTTGTAGCHTGGEGEESETKGIRFTIQ